jgi:hypothetical protein
VAICYRVRGWPSSMCRSSWPNACRYYRFLPPPLPTFPGPPVCLTFQDSNQGCFRVRRRAPVILIWVNTGTGSVTMGSRDSEHRDRGAAAYPSAHNDQGGFGDRDES